MPSLQRGSASDLLWGRFVRKKCEQGTKVLGDHTLNSKRQAVRIRQISTWVPFLGIMVLELLVERYWESSCPLWWPLSSASWAVRSSLQHSVQRAMVMVMSSMTYLRRVENGGMDPYSSPYILPKRIPIIHSPVLHRLEALAWSHASFQMTAWKELLQPSLDPSA